MTALQLTVAIVTPLATVVTAWINYRHTAEVEQWRTRRLALRLRSVRPRKFGKDDDQTQSDG